MKFLSRYAEESYALMRIATGFMFTFHGVQKILGVWTSHQPSVGSQVWFGGLIELFCGLAVMVGFRTRLAAFLCSGTMAVAYTQFHWKFQMGSKLLPGVNEGEMALLYAFAFLFIACRGAGKWGVEKG